MVAYKYGRKFSLVISSDNGTFDLSEFRVTFQVTHGSVGTPKTLRARIFNLSHGGTGTANTVSQIQAATNKTVTLMAYYESQSPSVLFSGVIRQVYAGRLSPVDTYLDIGASVLEEFHANAGLSTVLAAGWTHQQYFTDALIAQNAEKYGVSAGLFPSVPGSGARPKVCYGNARDALRVLGRNTASVMFQHDTGQIDIVPVNTTTQNTGAKTLFLTPMNGLIYTPVQIPDGVQATALLDSRLAVGSRVSVYSKNDSDSRTAITQADIDMSYGGTNQGNVTVNPDGTNGVAGLSHRGDYTILYADHVGDTRGENWYTVFVGQATDPSEQSVITSTGAGAVS